MWVILINRHNTVALGVKIKEMRIARGVTQDELASVASSDSPTISKIENGNLTCSDDLLWEIKKALGAENIPLLEGEQESFLEKLHEWYDVISKRNLPKASAIRDDLSAITCLPSEKELNLIYALFECRLLLGLNEIEPAKKILASIEPKIDSLTDIQRYHFYYNKGTFENKFARHKEALDFYMKAFDLTRRGLKESLSLYYNIAHCHYKNGLYSRSITFLEKARELFSSEEDTPSMFHIENLLATNFIRTNCLQTAKTLLDKCYKSVARGEDKTSIGMVLINYGYLYFKAEKYLKALDYLNEAEAYIDQDTDYSLEILYQKARCLVAMNRATSCAPMLKTGIERATGSDLYQSLFMALSHLLSLNQIDSRAYVEDVAIPYFLKTRNFIVALDYCESLAAYYSKKGKGYNGKRLKMVDLARNLYKSMYEGGVL
ncbi:MAG: helix-turn-helix transcriptional regulator [Defluviitaleaceae bacterium]|nr:helix-turn-helix transcriptional regulator [Defluviitaleaceae bacterium]